jgi:hypothetical protein
MDKGENSEPSSLSPVFISSHYSDYNKVVIEKVGLKIEKSKVLFCSMTLFIRATVECGFEGCFLAGVTSGISCASSLLFSFSFRYKERL